MSLTDCVPLPLSLGHLSTGTSKRNDPLPSISSSVPKKQKGREKEKGREREKKKDQYGIWMKSNISQRIY